MINAAALIDTVLDRTIIGGYTSIGYRVLGPFVLTAALVPLIRAGTAPARIINVSSRGMYSRRLDVDDLQNERGAFDGARAYAHTKRMQVVLTELGAQRLAPDGIVVQAMHPGWVDTPGVARSLPRFHRVTADRSCAHRSRARTRSSGSRRLRREPPAAAASGTTAAGGRRTCCPGPPRRRPSASDCGRSASASAPWGRKGARCGCPKVRKDGERHA